MKIVAILIKSLWAVIVIFWLWMISSGLTTNVATAQSAMQASQLYNEATTTILGIIAFTLILSFLDTSTHDTTEDIQKQVKYLAECTRYNNEILSRIEQLMRNSAAPNTISPIMPGAVIQAPTPKPTQLEQPLTNISSTPPCPKGHGPMQLRTVTKGENQGKQFYACSNYPKCQEFLPFPMKLPPTS